MGEDLRDEMALQAASWSEACVGDPSSTPDWEARYAAQTSAAMFGDIRAIACTLDDDRKQLAGATSSDEAVEAALDWGARLRRHEMLVLAYFRGADVADELDESCALNAGDILAVARERDARRNLADAVELGFLSSADLAAAKARDAARPACPLQNGVSAGD